MIFPNCLRHQSTKLSASGVDLGSDLLFARRIGFSGTLSNLLPTDLGECHFEIGSDGQVISTLTDPDVIDIVDIDNNWSVKTILGYLAKSRNKNGNGLLYNAFIDVAAVITGISNHGVALYLLENGLGDFVDGVVYLDEEDKKVCLIKSTKKVLPLDQCGIPPSRRFAFYDQIHTTGIDIGHKLDCKAAITIGKDTIFRDFAQGAFRLRQIGNGQTVDILVTPEMRSLITRTLAPVEGEQTNTNKSKFFVPSSQLLAPLDKILTERNITDEALIYQYKQLARISSFLILNSMESERTQFCQLAIQNCTNVWKKIAYKKLLSSAAYFNLTRFPTAEHTVQKQQQLAALQEETKTRTFLTSIESLRDTDKKSYNKLIKKYEQTKKQNKIFEAKEEQKILLEEYFKQSMTVYSVQLRAQLRNLAAKRDPSTCIQGVMEGLHKYLQTIRQNAYKDAQSTDDANTTRANRSLLGSAKLAAFTVTLGDDEQSDIIEDKNDGSEGTKKADAPEEFILRFASEDEMKEYADDTERD